SFSSSLPKFSFSQSQPLSPPEKVKTLRKPLIKNTTASVRRNSPFSVGYVEARTMWFDQKSGDATVEYSCYVLHY
ncbi:unnamed protein product, partial [Thlaspi arvense]